MLVVSTYSLSMPERCSFRCTTCDALAFDPTHSHAFHNRSVRDNPLSPAHTPLVLLKSLEVFPFCTLKSKESIFKFYALAPPSIDHPTTITAPLLLILHLYKPFPSRHTEILMSAVCIIIAAVSIRSHLGIYRSVFGDALESSLILGFGL